MGLIEQLQTDMKAALKNKESERLSVIRMVRAAIKDAEIEKRQALTDEEALQVVAKAVKQRRDSAAEYEKANRQDLAEKEQKEIDILIDYLPKQLSEEELRTIVQETVQELGATSKKEMGKVMGAVLPKIAGKADGKEVNRLVQEYLS
ncbi:GatB/YqeY domain-containing protein [Risungbinella massiliensis]|uniref:GatB/YqeY domain-containing protein n=1 Tax=Risungbinella massiliensis TaxID=1329796 RepID=UPI0005CBCC05|nr:GatB/YqeY domain-containing protein [Risungbinella massiliensis]